MDKRELFDTCQGKRIGCVVIFDNYKEKDYRKDFEEFANYQLTRGGGDEKPELKVYGLKDCPYIPFGYFKNNVTALFAQCLFFTLRQNPQHIISDELIVQIKLKRIPKFSYYFDDVRKASNPETVCYIAAGVWFIQAIVAPYYYFKSVDYSLAARYFAHELTHFSESQLKLTTYEEKYKLKMRRVSRRKSSYVLNCLYNSLFNLREEGTADFNARKMSDKVDINMPAIREYNRNLEKLVGITSRSSAYKFYTRKIGFQNLSPTGEYSCGRVMCFTIAMHLAKLRKQSYTIQFKGKDYWGFDFKELDSWLSLNSTIYLKGLSQEVLNAAYSHFAPTAHYYFVKMYENACDALGISEPNRVMTSKRFFLLVKKAEAKSKEERTKQLRNNGFDDSTISNDSSVDPLA